MQDLVCYAACAKQSDLSGICPSDGHILVVVRVLTLSIEKLLAVFNGVQDKTSQNMKTASLDNINKAVDNN